MYTDKNKTNHTFDFAKTIIDKTIKDIHINSFYNFATIEHFAVINGYVINEVGPDISGDNVLLLYLDNKLKYILLMVEKKSLSIYRCIFIYSDFPCDNSLSLLKSSDPL